MRLEGGIGVCWHSHTLYVCIYGIYVNIYIYVHTIFTYIYIYMHQTCLNHLRWIGAMAFDADVQMSNMCFFL